MNGARRRGRIEVRADDRSLTGHGGLVVIGDLAEKLDLIALIDGEIDQERRARPVKTRRRGASPGELVVSLAECQLVGGAFLTTWRISVRTSPGRCYARSPRCPRRRRRCRTPSGFVGCIASGSSARSRPRASGSTARSAVRWASGLGSSGRDADHRLGRHKQGAAALPDG